MDGIVAAYRLAVDEWLEAQLQPGTQARYHNSRVTFAAWLAKRGYVVNEFSGEQLDPMVARFILEGYEDEGAEHGRQFYVDLVASLQRRQTTRLSLSLSLSRSRCWAAGPATGLRSRRMPCRWSALLARR